MEDSIGKPNIGNKKTALEDLDRDELVKRCKSYLALAQRAKQAKDEAQEKETFLLDKISNLEGQVSQLVTQGKHCASSVQHEHSESQGFLLPLQVSDLESQLKLRDEEKILLLSRNEDTEAKLKALEENFEQQKNGFVEELNKMNDVLKQRGEAITRLEEKYQTSDKEFKVKTETFLQLVAEKERKIELLESEANRLETQSEILSTSTVSKAEEIHRMKDVEDSLEDRYNKLKMLAVRMKRRIAEQNSQLKDKDYQLAMLKVDEKNEKKNNICNTPSNMQAAQKEIDRLNDEIDTKKSELTMMKKDCENSIQELINSRQRAEEFKDENALLKATVANLEVSKKALEKSLQEHKLLYIDCRRETESEKILRVELSKECDRFKNEVQQLSCTVDELNKKNQAVKQETKKQSVLELELSDYEKSVAELNIQLNAMQKELVLKQIIVDGHTEEKRSLQAQVQLLEQHVATEQQRATELKMTVDAAQSQLDSCQSELLRQSTEIRHLISRAESKENEVDYLKLQLSAVDSELHKVRTGSTAVIETLRKQLGLLEESATTEKVTRENLDLQLSELRSEYENYKIRATNVFKKQKIEANPASMSSKEAVDEFNTDQVEREMLQRVVEALKTKIAELESQLACCQSELSNLRVERERTAATQASIVEAMRERLQHAESEIESIKQEHQAQVSRLQGDYQLLTSLYREQMDVLKLRHSQEILELQNNLDESSSESERLQKIISSYQSQRAVSPLIKNSDQRREEYAMIERERGEGSEDGNITFRQREDVEDDSRKPIPLELLLNSQLASECTLVFQNESETISYEQHHESLAIVEKRCNHLAALLAESEANEARLSQLADALKEEIRRSERSEERQKHIENLEYLKNVVLKFVTLPRGEERSRLVPVLTTLLRLSPLEVQEVHQTFNRTADGVVRPVGWGGVFNYFAPN